MAPVAVAGVKKYSMVLLLGKEIARYPRYVHVYVGYGTVIRFVKKRASSV